jgi:hypothetical protein
VTGVTVMSTRSPHTAADLTILAKLSSALARAHRLPLALRVRGIERVRLHADLTILAKLSCALARAHAVPLAA